METQVNVNTTQLVNFQWTGNINITSEGNEHNVQRERQTL